MSITDFLNARIAEDEAAARDAYDHDAWELTADDDGDSWVIARDRTGEGWRVAMAPPAPAIHMVNWDPTRALAECRAKRAILSMWTPVDLESEDRGAYFYAEGLGDAVKALASIYENHPDYQDEWRLENTEPLN